jgi:hypothetical protein
MAVRRKSTGTTTATDGAGRSRKRARRSDQRAARSGGMRGLRVLVAGLGLLAGAIAVLLIVRGPSGRDPGLGPGLIEDPETAGFGPGTRAFSLYFVDDSGLLVSEMRGVPEKPSRTRQIEAVLEELLAGSVRGHRSALPAGTMLRNLFTDVSGTVYVDLSRDAERGQPGNFSAEYASLAALVRTITANFPEFAAVQLLIDGEPATTLAGHFSIEHPLRADDWTAH